MNVVPITSTKHGATNGLGVHRTLPKSLEAEGSVLGGIILSPDALGLIAELEPNHFFDHRHQVVFQAIRTLQARGVPIDVTTLGDEIDKAGKFDAVGGYAFLGELALRVPTVDNVVTYARIVREKAVLRDLALELSRNLERVYNYNDQDEVDELIADAQVGVERVSKSFVDAGKGVPTITVHHALLELEKLSQTPVYKTPFEGLNAALGFGGLLSGQVYYLAGGTGFGKTSWIGSVVKHHALAGGQCLVAFYEMFAGYYVARMAAKGVGVHSNQILRCEVNMGAVAAQIPRGIEFLDSPSLETLRRAIDRVIRAGHPPPLVVVDYLQLVGDMISLTMQRPDPRLANTLASAGLRTIAKETGAVMLVVSAASRTVGKALTGDIRKMPPRDLIAAAKESGAIEYDGAGVIVLSVSNETDGFDGDMIATITVAKARFGEAQHLDARYDGKTGFWRELGRVAVKAKLNETTTNVRSAILDALSSGPIKTKNAVYEKTGGTKTTVLAEIDAMVEDGSIKRDGKGYGRREITPIQVPESDQQTDLPGGL